MQHIAQGPPDSGPPEGSGLPGDSASTPLALFTPCRVGLTSQGLTAEEHALNVVLSDLFSRADLHKLGFGLKYDLLRLHNSFPHLPCFGGRGRAWEAGGDAQDVDAGGCAEKGARVAGKQWRVETRGCIAYADPEAGPMRGHVDVLSLSRAAVPAMRSVGRCGLSKLALHVLGSPIDKTQQCSDWGVRPLSTEQLRYAAADAHVLTAIFDRCLAVRPALGAPGRLQQFGGQYHLTTSGELQAFLGCGRYCPQAVAGKAAPWCACRAGASVDADATRALGGILQI